jgi:uncharacterized damage-inducible protein DinB
LRFTEPKVDTPMITQPHRIYDYLLLARQRILNKVRSLSSEQLLQPFPIGLGTLAATLAHIVSSEWYYVQRMRRLEVPPYEQWAIRHEQPPPFAALEIAWAQQAADTRAAIDAVRDWQEPIEYRVTDDAGRRMIVTTCAADLFTQLAFHEIHHRAQAMNILTRFGAGVGEDLDFNTLMYQRREAQ